MERKIWFVFLFILNVSLPSFAYSPLTWKETQIPIDTPQGPVKLETLLVYPNDGAKHPIALISHGSPRSASDRPRMSALYYLPIAYEFARRGYAVAVVLRRGYGTSGGGWAERFGTCSHPNYIQAAQAASDDLHGAVNYLGTIKQFDTKKIIAVGFSAGGFATLAFTAFNPPAGLKAAINFAGGRGSLSNDNVCSTDALISAFATLGKTSRVPTLWVYAQNDHFFNPELAEKLLTAFTKSGGNATLIHANAFGKEGHFLFSQAGVPHWTPLVDNFLKTHHLTLVNSLLPLPTSSLKIPNYLSSSAQKAFANYTIRSPHKAFAISPKGGFGWRSGQRTKDDAAKNALEICNQYSSAQCKLIAIDDQMIH
ncbi:serine aminopeptidase domain-containing protein [Legionella lytica]|uniref:Serine aminopeptidase domain-containing protein n=1 Tax=Legionella lytica TaxID=96232 RepID=A0ABW8D4L5_9GAMM